MELWSLSPSIERISHCATLLSQKVNSLKRELYFIWQANFSQAKIYFYWYGAYEIMTGVSKKPKCNFEKISSKLLKVNKYKAFNYHYG
jgi:hypothetical protein